VADVHADKTPGSVTGPSMDSSSDDRQSALRCEVGRGQATGLLSQGTGAESQRRATGNCPSTSRGRGGMRCAFLPYGLLHRDHAATPNRRSRQDPPEMPLLQCARPQNGQNSRLLTQ
jgi:hypothetical protein